MQEVPVSEQTAPPPPHPRLIHGVAKARQHSYTHVPSLSQAEVFSAKTQLGFIFAEKPATGRHPFIRGFCVRSAKVRSTDQRLVRL